MYWFTLLIAGAFEVGWVISMKYSCGFTKIGASIIMTICMVISFIFLSISIKHIPIGTAYAAWTGIGAVGTAVFGIIALGESCSAIRITFLLLILVGIIGLKLSSYH